MSRKPTESVNIVRIQRELEESEYNQCPLCCAPLPPYIRPETRCRGCRSPLFRPPKWDAFDREILGRRASPRTAKTHLATVCVTTQAEIITVRMRDLSLNGVSFYSTVPLSVDQVFGFRDSALEALAKVASCRRKGRSYSVHAKILTVLFHNKSGVFVSTTV